MAVFDSRGFTTGALPTLAARIEPGLLPSPMGNRSKHMPEERRAPPDPHPRRRTRREPSEPIPRGKQPQPQPPPRADIRPRHRGVAVREQRQRQRARDPSPLRQPASPEIAAVGAREDLRCSIPLPRGSVPGFAALAGPAAPLPDEFEAPD